MAGFIADAILAYLVGSHVSDVSEETVESIKTALSDSSNSFKKRLEELKSALPGTLSEATDVNKFLGVVIGAQLELEREDILRRIELFNGKASRFGASPIMVGPAKEPQQPNSSFEEELTNLQNLAWMGFSSVVSIAKKGGWEVLGEHIFPNRDAPKRQILFLKKRDRMIGIARSTWLKCGVGGDYKPQTDDRILFITEAKQENLPED